MPRAGQRIFISYRRSDTRGYAGWLHQLLEERYGRSNVFRDVDSIGPGQHFPTEIARTIASCTDVFVLIGPGWMAPGADGRPRLYDEDDWVRLELETAVQRNLRIIPLLIGDTPMPPREYLPPSLQALTERQAFRLRDDVFVDDVRLALGRIDDVAEVDREYLGSARRNREDRFAELVRLFNDRLERDNVVIGSVPWRRVDAFRQQLEGMIEVLDSDEEVADLALATMSDQKMKQATVLLGVLALTPRRLVLVPRTRVDQVFVVWFRDVVDAKTSWMPGDFTLILRDRNVAIAVKPSKRAREIVGYVKDRAPQR